MADAVKEDETLHPGAVRLLGPAAVVAGTQGLAKAIKKPGLVRLDARGDEMGVRGRCALRRKRLNTYVGVLRRTTRMVGAPRLSVFRAMDPRHLPVLRACGITFAASLVVSSVAREESSVSRHAGGRRRRRGPAACRWPLCC